MREDRERGRRKGRGKVMVIRMNNLPGKRERER